MFRGASCGPYYALSAANIGEALHPFAGKELTILWSLSVEEHFYLLWPFAIRLLDRKPLIYLLTALLALEPIVRGVATAHVQSYWPHLCADAVPAGWPGGRQPARAAAGIA